MQQWQRDKSVIDLQLKFNKPIGLGIIGPGAEPQHIPPRLEPHARAAVAVSEMSYWGDIFNYPNLIPLIMTKLSHLPALS